MVGGLGQGLLVGDVVGLVVDDDQAALLLEHQVHDALDEVRALGEPDR